MKQFFIILILFIFLEACEGHINTPAGRSESKLRAKFQKPDSMPGPVMNLPSGKAGKPICELVSCVIQDHDGNFWFATLGDGVCRYDGKSFTWFTDKNGLCDNYVWTIQEDKKLAKGETGLWFGTRMGMCRFDGKKISSANEGFTDYSEKNGLGRSVYSLFQTDTGIVTHQEPWYQWFGATGGVYLYDGKFFSFLRLPEADSDKVSSRAHPNKYSSPYSVYSVLTDKNGNVWFGTESRGVCRFDGKSFTWFTGKGLNKAAVRAIYEDKNGKLWFGNNGVGLVCYDGKKLINFTEENGLENVDFMKNSILKDKPGTLARIWTIAEGKNGNLWFGTEDAGAWRYDGKTLTNYTKKEGLKSNAIYAIYKDQAGKLWFANYGGGICNYDGKSFTYLRK